MIPPRTATLVVAPGPILATPEQRSGAADAFEMIGLTNAATIWGYHPGTLTLDRVQVEKAYAAVDPQVDRRGNAWATREIAYAQPRYEFLHREGGRDGEATCRGECLPADFSVLFGAAGPGDPIVIGPVSYPRS